MYQRYPAVNADSIDRLQAATISADLPAQQSSAECTGGPATNAGQATQGGMTGATPNLMSCTSIAA